MTAKPKFRWYQFSLKSLLFAMTLVAIGSAWWSHRSFCLEQFRIHADRNGACARKVHDGIITESDFTKNDGVIGLGYSGAGDGSNGWGYLLEVSPTSSGYRRWKVTLSETPPVSEQQNKAEMDREAELADQYFHALWRPWERLGIND